MSDEYNQINEYNIFITYAYALNVVELFSK